MLAVGPLGPQHCLIFAWYELGRQAHLGVDTLPSQRVPQKILKKSISLYYGLPTYPAPQTSPSTSSGGLGDLFRAGSSLALGFLNLLGNQVSVKNISNLDLWLLNSTFVFCIPHTFLYFTQRDWGIFKSSEHNTDILKVTINKLIHMVFFIVVNRFWYNIPNFKKNVFWKDHSFFTNPDLLDKS